MTQYYGQFAPELLTTQFAKEIWALYQAGDFDPEAELTGEYQAPTAAADVDAVLDEIKAAFAQMQERQLRQQEQDDD
jgi:RIO kinase 1